MWRPRLVTSFRATAFRATAFRATSFGATLALLCLACGGSTPNDTADSTGHILLPVADDPTISFTVWFKVGSQNDPQGQEGLAQLTGAMLSDGSTSEHSYEQILDKLYPLASTYDVRVDKEMTTLTGRTHRDNLETFFGLLQDAYLRPAFTAEDFERLRSDQLNFIEKTLRFASDEELGKAALTRSIFADTPYSHPIAGTAAGLNGLTLEDVKQFYATHYTRDNAVIALGGGYDDELVGRFADSLAALPDEAARQPVNVDPAAISGRQVTLVSKPGADASISFGFPIDLQRGSRDFYALWLANSWLGEHRNSSSHLYGVIREVRGMNYGDYSYIEAYPEGGFRQMPPTGIGRKHQLFEVWIRTLPNNQALFALRAALREIDTLINDGMTQDDFELTRSFLSKYYLHYAESTGRRLGYRVDDHFYGIEGEGHLAQFATMMSSLTHDEVNAAIKKYLQLDNLQIAIVTGEAEALQSALLADTPSPMTYASEKSAEVLAEDKEIESFPLNIAAGGVRTVPVSEIFGE